MSERTRLRTTGMHCPSCATLIEMNVGGLDGVEHVSVDLDQGSTEVSYDPDTTDLRAIIAEITRSGYGVEEG